MGNITRSFMRCVSFCTARSYEIIDNELSTNAHNKTIERARIAGLLDQTKDEIEKKLDAQLRFQHLISEFNAATAYKQELTNRHTKLKTQKEENAAYWKTRLRSIRNTLLTIGDLGGTAGFVANIILSVGELLTAVGSVVSYFVGVIASPLALIAISLGTLLDTYNIYENNAIEQRKTRYAANIATVAFAVTATLIALGTIALPSFSIAILFMGIVAANYYKDAYILKNLEPKIAAEKVILTDLRLKITAEINQLCAHNPFLESRKTAIRIAKRQLTLTLVNEPNNIEKIQTLRASIAEQKSEFSQRIRRDSHINRLIMQYNDRVDAITELKITRKNLITTQQNRKWSLLAVGLIIAGGILGIVFPPAAGVFLVTGAVLVLATVLNGFQQQRVEKQAALERKTKLENRDESHHEETRIANIYDQQLTFALPAKMMMSTAMIAADANIHPKKLSVDVGLPAVVPPAVADVKISEPAPTIPAPAAKDGCRPTLT